MEPVDLRTADLTLRTWLPDDGDALWRACQDPILRRWGSGLPVPFPRAAAGAFLAAMAQELAADTAVSLGIFATDTGELLGSTALHRIDRDRGTAEIGYWSAPWARGRRVTERASRALLQWGFSTLGLYRVDWKATVGNHASLLTGLRLGVHLVGVLPGEGRDRDGTRIDRWLGAIRATDLTAAGTDVGVAVRRRAYTFGADQPTLTGAGGVRLRPAEQRDEVGIVDCCRDPDAVRFTMVPDPYGDADAARFVREHAPAVWARGTGAVFVVTGPDDAYAGTIDLRVSSADPAVADVGYLIAPPARGRGYATAALRAVAAWGFAALALERIEWQAHVDNPASRRVAEKVGFRIEGVQRGGLAHRGQRPDCWLGALLPGDLSGSDLSEVDLGGAYLGGADRGGDNR